MPSGVKPTELAPHQNRPARHRSPPGNQTPPSGACIRWPAAGQPARDSEDETMIDTPESRFISSPTGWADQGSYQWEDRAREGWSRGREEDSCLPENRKHPSPTAATAFCGGALCKCRFAVGHVCNVPIPPGPQWHVTNVPPRSEQPQASWTVGWGTPALPRGTNVLDAPQPEPPGSGQVVAQADSGGGSLTFFAIAAADHDVIGHEGLHQGGRHPA